MLKDVFKSVKHIFNDKYVFYKGSLKIKKSSILNIEQIF
jgi:hypothetical protein